MLGRMVVVSILGVLLDLSSLASAAPPSPLWRVPHGCQLFRATATELVALDDGARHLVKLERATGKRLPKVKLPPLGPRPKGELARIAIWFGSTFVIDGKTALDAIDVTSGTRRWHYDAPNKHVQPIYLAQLGTDLVVRTMVRGKGKHTDVVVERLDGASGASQWSVTLPDRHGFWIGASAAHVFVVDHAGTKDASIIIAALDPATGHTQWSIETPADGYQTPRVGGDDLVMSIGADKLALIDGATGETAITAMAIATIETVGSRAYVVRGDDQSGNHSITAYDPATRKALWTTPQSSNRVYMLGGTASAIYIHDNDELVRALDPATGKVLWTYGVGDTPYVYNYPDTPIITFCSGPDLKSDLVAIDPSAPAVEDEAITVTGTLTCADCETPRLDVRVGDAFGKTDEHGRFTLNTTGRGTFVLSVRFGNEWTHVKPIKLTGKKTYDLGAITTSPPPEGG